jgi:hypothetical protein
MTLTWVLYDQFSLVAALLLSSAAAAGLIEAEVTMPNGRTLHPFVALCTIFCIGYVVWPLVVAVCLKEIHDDDGPWRG